jgi:hypothetical protein
VRDRWGDSSDDEAHAAWRIAGTSSPLMLRKQREKEATLARRRENKTGISVRGGERDGGGGTGVAVGSMDYQGAANDMVQWHPRKIALRLSQMSSEDGAGILSLLPTAFAADVVMQMLAPSAAMILDLCHPYNDIAPIFKLVTNVDVINQVGFAAKIVSHMTEAGL